MAMVAGALTVAAIAGFIVAPQLLGNGVTVTSADPPGAPSTQVTTGAGPSSTPPEPFGTGMLLQTDDFYQLGLDFDGAEQRSDGGQSLTGCTGRATMRDVATDNQSGDQKNGDPDYASALWRSQEYGSGGRTTLRESVSRGTSTRSTQRIVSDLTRELAGCRYRQDGDHRRLGSPKSVHGVAGSAVRFVAYDPDGASVGGVGVFRSGRNFGIFELVGAGTDDPGGMLESLSAAAVKRIS
jgi:hypothetical protein